MLGELVTLISPPCPNFFSNIHHATSSPRNSKELFNLRHASLRNIIERIFGVMKRQWRVLQLPPEYSMFVQARIPAALCALHNFIHRHDPDMFDALYDGQLLEHDGIDDVALGELGDGPADAAERDRANARRDAIASAMWQDYTAECVRRGIRLPV
jgi:hypothetical protein